MINWIKAHSQPARLVTRIWWSNDESDYSDCPSNNGTFDSSCFPSGKSAANAVKVEFGPDVTSIDDWVFSSCLNLTSVMMPNNVTSIGNNTFYGCDGLTNIMIPQFMCDDNVHYFDFVGHREDNNLNITLASGVSYIGHLSFTDSVFSRLIIPSSVITIADNAFIDFYPAEIVFQGKTLEQVQNIEDENGNKCYPWGIEDTSIIHVA